MTFFKSLLAGLKTKTKNSNRYLSYYLFGKSNDQPIWIWENWKECIALLDPIVALTSERPFIKTSQSVPVNYGKDKKNVSFDKGSLKFGKMAWNLKNNEKWTTKYSKEKNWTFFDIEIAYPSRSQCQKSGEDPILYISIHNENLLNNPDANFDQAMTIHVRMDLMQNEETDKIDELVSKLGELINWNLGGRMTRTAYIRSKDDSFRGNSDTIWNGTYSALNSENDGFSDLFNYHKIERIK
jgi:hypothetical protein